MATLLSPGVRAVLLDSMHGVFKSKCCLWFGMGGEPRLHWLNWGRVEKPSQVEEMDAAAGLLMRVAAAVGT